MCLRGQTRLVSVSVGYCTPGSGCKSAWLTGHICNGVITFSLRPIQHPTVPCHLPQLQFQSDLLITHMYSGEGEEVKLFLPVMPSGNVEDWLREVEKSMKASLRDNIDRSLKEYPEVSLQMENRTQTSMLNLEMLLQ